MSGIPPNRPTYPVGLKPLDRREPISLEEARRVKELAKARFLEVWGPYLSEEVKRSLP